MPKSHIFNASKAQHGWCLYRSRKMQKVKIVMSYAINKQHSQLHALLLLYLYLYLYLFCISC